MTDQEIFDLIISDGIYKIIEHLNFANKVTSFPIKYRNDWDRIEKSLEYLSAIRWYLDLVKENK